MGRLTLADVLCRAVDDLLAIRKVNEVASLEDLQELKTVLQFLADVNTERSGPDEGSTERWRDTELGLLLDDLLDAIRDSHMGTPWKSEIPSHETIRSRLA